MPQESQKNLRELYKLLGDTSTDIRNKNLYVFLLPFIKGKTLLDIGSGRGHFMNLAKKIHYSVEGIEPDKKLIEMTEKTYGKIGNIYNIRAEEIDRIKKKYDTIILIDVLEHIKDDGNQLKLIRKRLNKGGRCIILVPAYQFLYSMRDKSIGHYRRYTVSSLTGLMEDAGFSIIHKRYWNMLGFFIYALFEKILRKRAPHNLRIKPKGKMQIFHKFVHLWMRYVEHKYNVGFGLSALVVGEHLD